MGCALALLGCDPSGVIIEERPHPYLRDGVLYLVPTPEARPYLETWLPLAEDRLWRASGLSVELSPDWGAPAVLEPFKAEEDGWYGSFRNGVLSLSIQTISTLAERPSGVLLHEVMHAHGAPHVPQGQGLMSPKLSGAEPLTEADLMSLCEGSGACTTFNPEAE